MVIDICRNLFTDIGFKTRGCINRAVEIPTAETTFRTDDDQLISVCKCSQLRYFLNPVTEIATVTMKQVHRRKKFPFSSSIRNNYNSLVGTVHGVAEDGCRINPGCIKRYGNSNQKAGKKSFHVKKFWISIYLYNFD